MPAPPVALSDCRPGTKGATPARIWRLTASQYDATLKELIGAPVTATNPFEGADGRERFSNLSRTFGMPEATLDVMYRTSATAAQLWATSLGQRLPCVTTLNDACVKEAVTLAGRRAFRRPLTTDESDRFSKLISANRATQGAPAALQIGLEAMLNSPHFVFRFELGGGTADGSGRMRLTAHELAAAIAYTVTDAPPDAMLSTAADQGQLTTPEQVRSHVVRLLGNAAASPTISRFVREYFKYEMAVDVFKDAARSPYHKPAELVSGTDLMVKDVLGLRKNFVETLLTSRVGFVSDNTAESHGVARPRSSQSTKVQLPTDQRAGILTHPSFLAAFSHNMENDPIRRGKFISESLLCRPVPDLPMDVVPKLPDLGPSAQLRDKLKQHSEDPSCAACHDFMDPLGLAFEAYDDTGRWRTMESGRAVNATGELTDAGEVDGPVNGAVELAERLSKSSVVRECFVKHTFQFWMGREPAPADACTLAAAHDTYVQTGGDLVETIVSLFTSDPFLYRTPIAAQK